MYMILSDGKHEVSVFPSPFIYSASITKIFNPPLAFKFSNTFQRLLFPMHSLYRTDIRLELKLIQKV